MIGGKDSSKLPGAPKTLQGLRRTPKDLVLGTDIVQQKKKDEPLLSF